MADTLLGFVDSMDGMPDNSSQLVSAQDVRQSLLSSQSDRGASFASGGPWTVPIVAIGTWVDIPVAVGVDMVQSPAVLFWRMDANGHLFYNYTADWSTTTVPAGLIRAVTLTAVIGLDPNGDTWEFAFTVAGVIQEPVEIVETAGQTDAVTLTLIAGQGIEPFVAPPVSVQVRNMDTASDLTLLSFAYNVRGGPLA